MLVMRTEQMEALHAKSRAGFEAEMARHLAAFSPRHCEVIGAEQLELVIRRGLGSAARHGFTNRGPVKLFLEFMFLFGSAFDTDPLLPWVGRALQPGGLIDDQMQRADILWRELQSYVAAVDGPAHAHTIGGLRRLRDAFDAPPPLPSEIAGRLRAIHPEKCAYAGDGGLRGLVAEAAALAARLGLPGDRGLALTAGFMFALGHGFHEDPLYPWIPATFADPRLRDPGLLLETLEKRGKAFLGVVLAEACPT